MSLIKKKILKLQTGTNKSWNGTTGVDWLDLLNGKKRVPTPIDIPQWTKDVEAKNQATNNPPYTPWLEETSTQTYFPPQDKRSFAPVSPEYVTPTPGSPATTKPLAPAKPAYETVADTWQKATGMNWLEARKLGLTDGSAKLNLALQDMMRKNPESIQKVISQKQGFNRAVANPSVNRMTPTTGKPVQVMLTQNTPGQLNIPGPKMVSVPMVQPGVLPADLAPSMSSVMNNMDNNKKIYNLD